MNGEILVVLSLETKSLRSSQKWGMQDLTRPIVDELHSVEICLRNSKREIVWRKYSPIGPLPEELKKG